MKKNIHRSFGVIKLIFSSLIFLLSVSVDAQVVSYDARLLASQCAQCHGTTGNTQGDFDSIAGGRFSDLYDELIEMKADNDNEVMHKQIQGYTASQIWLIADYYSRLSKSDSTNNSDSGNDSDSDRSDEESNGTDEDDDNALLVSTEAEKKQIKKAKKKAKKAAKKKAKKAKKSKAKKDKKNKEQEDDDD